VPDLGRWLNRRPTYELSRAPSRTHAGRASHRNSLRRKHTHEDTGHRPLSKPPTLQERPSQEVSRIVTPVTTSRVTTRIPSQNKPLPELPNTEATGGTPQHTRIATQSEPRNRRESIASIASEVRDEHYAVLPHGVSLDDWSEQDKEMLDDHVRHMLHSKRSKFKQTMKAFGKYVRKRKLDEQDR